jgi:hypothetical protein
VARPPARRRRRAGGVAAGALATASVAADLPPLLQWSVALVGGGTVAGAVQGATSLVRVASSATTGGVANPLVATGEWVAAAATAVLAILVPALALLALGVLLFAIYRFARRAFRRRAPAA